MWPKFRHHPQRDSQARVSIAMLARLKCLSTTTHTLVTINCLRSYNSTFIRNVTDHSLAILIVHFLSLGVFPSRQNLTWIRGSKGSSIGIFFYLHGTLLKLCTFNASSRLLLNRKAKRAKSGNQLNEVSLHGKSKLFFTTRKTTTTSNFIVKYFSLFH